MDNLDANQVEKRLKAMAKPDLAAFNARIVPTVAKEKIIGVRVPQIRALAREMIHLQKKGSACCSDFLAALPHVYLEENQLHAILISEYPSKVSEACDLIQAFSVYIDSWIVADAIRPYAFKRDPDSARQHILDYLLASNSWLIRVGLQEMIRLYSDERFMPSDLERVAEVDCNYKEPEKLSDDYYLAMALSWYYSMIFVKHTQDFLSWFVNQSFSHFVHNMTLQKVQESRQANSELKKLARQLRQVH